MLNIAPVGDMAQTAAGEVQMMAGVSQRLPWPAKLEARGRVAAQAVAEAAAELQRVRLEIASDARRAYWRLYATTRSLEQLRQMREPLQQMRQSTRARS